MKQILAVIAICIMLLAGSAWAEQYIIPSDRAILQTMLRFGALDINTDVVIDDYAKLAECDLYTVFHENEFKWDKIRKGLRNKIRQEASTYPTNYMIKGFVSLDRYDFKNKIFLMSEGSSILNVNAFKIMVFNNSYCQKPLKVLPRDYLATIDTRINIPGFIMSEADAQAMLDRFNKANNKARQIVVKFNIQIIDVPLVRIDRSNVAAQYDPKTFVGLSPNIVLSAKLNSVEFYEEPEMKRRISIYIP